MSTLPKTRMVGYLTVLGIIFLIVGVSMITASQIPSIRPQIPLSGTTVNMTISVASGQGQVCWHDAVSGCTSSSASATFTIGDLATFTANAANGYSFTQWNLPDGTHPTSNPITKEIPFGSTISASFSSGGVVTTTTASSTTATTTPIAGSPTISLSPTTVNWGQSFTVSGSQFTPNVNTVTIHIGTQTYDCLGCVNGSGVLPPIWAVYISNTIPAGNYGVYVSDPVKGNSNTVQLTIIGTTTTTTSIPLTLYMYCVDVKNIGQQPSKAPQLSQINALTVSFQGFTGQASCGQAVFPQTGSQVTVSYGSTPPQGYVPANQFLTYPTQQQASSSSVTFNMPNQNTEVAAYFTPGADPCAGYIVQIYFVDQSHGRQAASDPKGTYSLDSTFTIEGDQIQAGCQIDNLPVMLIDWQDAYATNPPHLTSSTITDRIPLTSGTIGTTNAIFSKQYTLCTTSQCKKYLNIGIHTPNGDRGGLATLQIGNVGYADSLMNRILRFFADPLLFYGSLFTFVGAVAVAAGRIEAIKKPKKT